MNRRRLNTTGCPISLGGSDDAESDGVDSEPESDSESLDGEPSDTELIAAV